MALISNLPREILTYVFSFFETRNLWIVARVCKEWRFCAFNWTLWNTVDLSFMNKKLFEEKEAFIELGKKVGPHVRRLSLSRCQVHDALFVKFLDLIPNVQAIDVSDTPLSSTSISRVLDTCKGVAEIDASGTQLELQDWVKLKKNAQEAGRNVNIHAGHVLFELSVRKRQDFLTNQIHVDPRKEGIKNEWLSDKSLLWCLKNCSTSAVWMDQVIECFENSPVDWSNVDFSFIEKHLTQFHMVRALKKAGFNRWQEADPHRLNSFIRRNSFREVPPILAEWSQTEFNNWSAVWNFEYEFVEKFLSHSWGFEDLHVLGNARMHEFCRDKIDLEKLVKSKNLQAIQNLGLMGFETLQQISQETFVSLLRSKSSEMLQALSRFLSNLPEIQLSWVEEVLIGGDLKMMDSLDACRFDWDQISPDTLIKMCKMDLMEPISKLKELGYSRWGELEIPVWVDRGARGLLYEFILNERNQLINSISEVEIKQNYQNFRKMSSMSCTTDDIEFSTDWEANDLSEDSISICEEDTEYLE